MMQVQYVPMKCKESNHMIVKHAKHAMIAVCYVLKRANKIAHPIYQHGNEVMLLPL
jgi:hypothetical protein